MSWVRLDADRFVDLATGLLIRRFADGRRDWGLQAFTHGDWVALTEAQVEGLIVVGLLPRTTVVEQADDIRRRRGVSKTTFETLRSQGVDHATANVMSDLPMTDKPFTEMAAKPAEAKTKLGWISTTPDGALTGRCCGPDFPAHTPAGYCWVSTAQNVWDLEPIKMAQDASGAGLDYSQHPPYPPAAEQKPQEVSHDQRSDLPPRWPAWAMRLLRRFG